jgi:soluble lytic murein transglycosylase-like protein
MQTLPSTAQEMAGKLGMPWRPDLLTAQTPEAANYQRQLGQAYLQEGYNKTGNWRDAFRYYYGGPNRSMWGPKTNAYADDAMRRMGAF